MKITFACTPLKKIISLLKGVFNDVSFHFESDGLHIYEVDPLKTSAYCITLIPEKLEHWREPVIHGFNVMELYNLLRLTKNGDKIQFETSATNEMFMYCYKEDEPVNWKAVYKNHIIPVHTVRLPECVPLAKIRVSRQLLFAQMVWAAYWIGSEILLEVDPEQNKFILKSDTSESELIASESTFEWLLLPKSQAKFRYLSKFIMQVLRKELDKEIKLTVFENGILVLHYEVEGVTNFDCIISPIKTLSEQTETLDLNK